MKISFTHQAAFQTLLPRQTFIDVDACLHMQATQKHLWATQRRTSVRRCAAFISFSLQCHVHTILPYYSDIHSVQVDRYTPSPSDIQDVAETKVSAAVFIAYAAFVQVLYVMPACYSEHCELFKAVCSATISCSPVSTLTNYLFKPLSCAAVDLQYFVWNHQASCFCCR